MQALDDGAELVIAPVVLLELEVGVIRSSSAEVARKALSDGHRARLPVSDRRRTVHI